MRTDSKREMLDYIILLKREMLGYIILLLDIRTKNGEGMCGLRHYDH